MSMNIGMGYLHDPYLIWRVIVWLLPVGYLVLLELGWITKPPETNLSGRCYSPVAVTLSRQLEWNLATSSWVFLQRTCMLNTGQGRTVLNSDESFPDAPLPFPTAFYAKSFRIPSRSHSSEEDNKQTTRADGIGATLATSPRKSLVWREKQTGVSASSVRTATIVSK